MDSLRLFLENNTPRDLQTLWILEAEGAVVLNGSAALSKDRLPRPANLEIRIPARPSAEERKEKKKLPYLYIVADEDHVAA